MRVDGAVQVQAGVTIGASGGVQGASAQDKEHGKLVDAAQQFEAMLLQQMLKPFEDGVGSLDGWGGGDGDSGEGSGSTLRGFGTEAMAKAIAKGGGLGIARQIVAKVTLERKSSLEDAHPAKVSNGVADKPR